MTEKPLQPTDKIVMSLLNLRNEILENGTDDATRREYLFKINSCLYREYPTHPDQNQFTFPEN